MSTRKRQKILKINNLFVPPNPSCSGRRKEQTTPKRDTTYKKTKISHPYHPRHGEEVEIIRKCRGDNILVSTDKGERIVVATDWTEDPTEREGIAPVVSHLLDYGGLVEAMELIEQIRGKESRTEEEGYDGEYPSQVEPSSEVQNDPGSCRQRTEQSEPGVGSVKPGSPGWGDRPDGAVSAEIGRCAAREQEEGGGR
jgi:hypothetical protein